MVTTKVHTKISTGDDDNKEGTYQYFFTGDGDNKEETYQYFLH
jgi:hypothetical protein